MNSLFPYAALLSFITLVLSRAMKYSRTCIMRSATVNSKVKAWYRSQNLDIKKTIKKALHAVIDHQYSLKNSANIDFE